MNGPNPFAAPEAPLVGGGLTGQENDGNVTHGVLEALRATKPWVRFLGVLSGIGAGLMVLIGLVFMLTGLSNTRGMPPALGLVYIAFAGIYVIPTVYLNRYASCINDLLASNRQEDLEGALRVQKSFWKFVGIVALVILSLYVLIFIGLIAFGAFAASRKF